MIRAIKGLKDLTKTVPILSIFYNPLADTGGRQERNAKKFTFYMRKSSVNDYAGKKNINFAD